MPRGTEADTELRQHLLEALTAADDTAAKFHIRHAIEHLNAAETLPENCS